jgi:hypothetical protein
MMIMASNEWDTDFASVQDDSDLMVWLRRTGSNPDGDPPFVIREVFRPQRWTTVDLILLRGDLRIDINGRTRLTEHLPADSLQTWARDGSRSARRSSGVARGRAGSASRGCAPLAMPSITSVRAHCLCL